MALSAKRKLMLLDTLDIFKALGIAALLVFAIQSLHAQSTQLKTTKSQVIATKAVVDQIKAETQELKTDNHTDHDTLLKSINCIAELFGEHPNSYIPKSEFDACLAGTRIAPTDDSATSTSPSAPANTNTNSQNQTPTTQKSSGQASTNPNKNSQTGQSGSLPRAWHSFTNFVRRIF